MVDHFFNALLALLGVGILVLLSARLESPTVMPAPTKSPSITLPMGWVKTQGRWACDNVTPDSLLAMLRVLRSVSRMPAKICIEPPVAEVIW